MSNHVPLNAAGDLVSGDVDKCVDVEDNGTGNGRRPGRASAVIGLRERALMELGATWTAYRINRENTRVTGHGRTKSLISGGT
ncbi:MAG: hypothetical protein JWO67_2088 [Streptosporangiaceae bacterium]|nr:hypothetical protein [Streptosporangiaceae bacterium]